jgi:hypothetical protein
MISSLLAPRSMLLVTGFAVGVAAIGAWSLSGDDSGSRPLKEGVAHNAPVIGVCDGEVSTLALAKSQSPFRLLMPAHPLADRSNLRSVWDCSGNTAALDFASGVTVYLSVNTLGNPTAEWAGLAASYPEYSVGTVRGAPAALVDPANGDGTARGGVNLVESSLRIAVAGNGKISLSDLIDVTESLAPEG